MPTTAITIEHKAEVGQRVWHAPDQEMLTVRRVEFYDAVGAMVYWFDNDEWASIAVVDGNGWDYVIQPVVQPLPERWYNVYTYGIGGVGHLTMAQAEAGRSLRTRDYLGLLHTWTDGEGTDRFDFERP